MSNSTVPDGFRQCDSRDKCLHPEGPILPISEFYKARPNRCKLCHRAGHKPYANERKAALKHRGYEAENLAIEKLRSIGIYAVMGRECKQFRHVDLVAYGCVRIECKASTFENGQCTFNFTSQKNSGGIKADLILLIPYRKGIATYHLFPAGHPVFYRRGKLKTGLQYLEYVNHRKNVGTYLSPALMNEHKDAWHLIEQKRLEIAELLKAGEYEPKMVTHAMPLQPRLFDFDDVAR